MPINEQMILDVVLSQHKLLIIPTQTFTKREILLKIVDWVNNGGVIFGIGLMKDLELDSVWEYANLFGITNKSDETWVHCQQFIDPDDTFPEFSKIKLFHYEVSLSGLDKNVILLSSTKPGPTSHAESIQKTGSAFYKKNGKGIAIFYCGPVMLVEDKEKLFTEPKVFSILLDYVLNNYSDTVNLIPGPNEVARAEIDNNIYALKDLEIIKVK